MDNLRNFFSRFVWTRKPEDPEFKSDSKINPKFLREENFSQDRSRDNQFYSFVYKSPGQDRTLEENFEYPDNQDTPSHEFNPHHNQRPVFGDIFSVVGEMFRDMERSMHDVNQFFESSELFNHPGFGMLDDITPGQFPNALEDHENSSEKATKRKCDRNSNLRDQILKADSPISDNEKIDTVLDDLYKQNKLDLNDLPLLTEEEKPKSTQLVPLPHPNQSMRTRTSSQSSYSFTNGKCQLKEKLIKETNGGKEVTTRTTNEKGEVESKTEFIPYNSSANTVKSFDNGEDELMKMVSIFDRFFKPRM